MLFLVCYLALPYEFTIGNAPDIIKVRYYYCFFSITAGLWSGLIIGLSTDYYTSYSHDPVLELVDNCSTGPAANLISGFALGFISTIIPSICIALTIYVAYDLAGMYGIALGALGMLSTMCIGLTVDGYGPISDNAGGITEMAKIGEDVREKTDKLDAAGNTTAAIGKGFAIGSASLVSLALFGAFVTRSHLAIVDIISPLEFCGLLIGAMLPYSFSSMTMNSVGRAANMMVLEVRRQLVEKRRVEKETGAIVKPDYKKCIAISTEASLKEMIAPGCLVIFTPLTIGFLFGPKGVAGILAGALISGVQMVIK
jgi:inorganic pyrophosphatase